MNRFMLLAVSAIAIIGISAPAVAQCVGGGCPTATLGGSAVGYYNPQPVFNVVPTTTTTSSGVTTSNVNVKTSGCQSNTKNAIACMFAGAAAQAIAQALVTRAAVREQVRGQVILARTFQSLQQQQQQRTPIGNCVSVTGQNIVVYQGDDPNQICQ